MSLLCWKFCPARESCGYMCANTGRICCCLGSSTSKEALPTDPLVDAKNSKLSVRRISRINSEESLYASDEQLPQTTNPYILTPQSSHQPGYKFAKKISLHKKALKSMIKGGYVSSPELRTDESYPMERRDGGGGVLKGKRKLSKRFVVSSNVDLTEDEKRELEEKQKIKTMLRMSRTVAKGMKEKQQMPGGLSPPQEPVLPPHPSCRKNLDPSQVDGSSVGRLSPLRALGSYNSQGYGSREEESDLAFSDEDAFGSRSLYGSSQEHLLADEGDMGRSYGSSEWKADTGGHERGEGDGSSMDVGSKDNPAKECFGSITLSARFISSKVVSVSIHSLQGLPCRKGKDGGLCLEVLAMPGGKTIWLPLPQAKGPKVIVNSDVTIRISHAREKEYCVRTCVWTAGRTWKHCALGSAIASVTKSQDSPVTLGLYHHTKAEFGIGILEVSLESRSEDTKANIQVHIQRARFSKGLIFDKSLTGLKSVYKHKRDVWCRLTLWSKGRRMERISTPKIFLPVTYDPNFRSMSKFQVNRSMLPFTSLVIKVLCDKGFGLGEVLLGKVILGPHLYLGIAKGDTPPGTLSHWGKALTHTGPVTSWHYLYQ